jgi:methionine-rich copper-binding protein CopC
MLAVFAPRVRTILFVAMTAASLPGPALAHAELVSSAPADGAMLDSPPREIVITFEGELQPEGSGFAVAGAGGEVGTGGVDLQVAERNVLRGDVAITEPGIYTVKWTVVAADGDEQLGDFSFTVSGGTVPVTAVATPDGPMRSALTLTGMLLLAAGLWLLRRRVAP